MRKYIYVFSFEKTEFLESLKEYLEAFFEGI